MPSVLAEIGFISNPKDEALLKKDSTPAKDRRGTLQRPRSIRWDAQSVSGREQLDCDLGRLTQIVHNFWRRNKDRAIASSALG